MYARLYASITTSSIWSEDLETRVLFISMLAACDKGGCVYGATPGLARLSNLQMSSVEKGLDRLMSPDQYSADPSNEGRRIEKIPGGWAIINYSRYRDIERQDDRRQAWRERQQRHRKRASQMSRPIVTSHALSPKSPSTQLNSTQLNPENTNTPPPLSTAPPTAAKGDKPPKFVPPTPEQVETYAESINHPGFDGLKFCAYYATRGWIPSGSRTQMKSWKAAVVTFLKNEAGR